MANLYCDTSGLSTRPDLTIHHPIIACKQPNNKIIKSLKVTNLFNFLVTKKYINGIMKKMPINLPHRR